ncbi:MAG: dipicolinate synthase subunit B [Eubacterium sp.]|nr:dipicolinate synthase subunit B [Eubacterium sp.]
MKSIRIGYCITGSFCTFEKSINALEKLVKDGYDVQVIMSENAYNTDTRFGTSKSFIKRIITITNKDIIHTISKAEPIGPKKLFDIIVVAPCTGNTLAKLNLGITDTAVTMAVKSHIRNNRPVLIGVSTNDALGAAAKNIGSLMNYKNYYFIPYSPDDPINKPKSLICEFDKIEQSIKNLTE